MTTLSQFEKNYTFENMEMYQNVCFHAPYLFIYLLLLKFVYLACREQLRTDKVVIHSSQRIVSF